MSRRDGVSIPYSPAVYSFFSLDEMGHVKAVNYIRMYAAKTQEKFRDAIILT